MAKFVENKPELNNKNTNKETEKTFKKPMCSNKRNMSEVYDEELNTNTMKTMDVGTQIVK